MSPLSGRRRLPLALALAGLVVLVPLVVYATGRGNDAFDVSRVVVTGQRSAHTRELRTTVSSEFLGENLFGIGTGDVRKALAGYPYIADVAVDRDFPQTLRVRVTEYAPAALLQDGSDWYVVSSDGRVFAAAVPPSPTPMPSASAKATATATPDATAVASGAGATTVVSPSASPSGAAAALPPEIPAALRHLPVFTSDMPVKVGMDVVDQRVKDALALIEALPPRLRTQVASTHASTSTARAVFRNGLLVEFGSVGDLRSKVAALTAILTRYQTRHVTPTYLDVSVPGFALGRPVLPTPSAP